MAYDTAAIRNLLAAAFSDEEFTAFCYDHFRLAYESFAGGMSKSQKIQILIEHCERTYQLSTLLDRVRAAKPAQYARFEPRLSAPSPATSPSGEGVQSTWEKLEQEGDKAWEATFTSQTLEAAQRFRLEAESSYKKAWQDAMAQAKGTAVVVRLHRKLARSYRKRDEDTDAARDELEEGLRIINKLPSSDATRLEEMELRMELAFCDFQDRELKSGMSLVEGIIEACSREPLYGHPDVWYLLGNAYSLLGLALAFQTGAQSRFGDNPEDCWRKAERYFPEDLVGVRGKMDVIGNRALVLKLRGRYDEAIADLESIIDTSAPERKLIVLNNLAAAYTEKGDVQQALRYAREALQGTEAFGDIGGQIRAREVFLKAVGACLDAQDVQYDRHKLLDEAESVYARGLEFLDFPKIESLEASQSRLELHRVMAEIHLAAGDIPRAEKLGQQARQALDSAVTIRPVPIDEKWDLEVTLARIEYRRGNVGLALDRLAEARNRFEEAGELGKVVRIDIERATMMIQKGDFSSAQAVLNRARDITLRLGNRQNKDRIDELLAGCGGIQPEDKLNQVPVLTQSGLTQADFAVITALPEEAKAVVGRLENCQVCRFEQEDIRTFHLGTVPIQRADQVYHVVVVQLPTMGPVSAANAVTDTIVRWKPRFILMVGIAGGIPQDDLDLGDVVVADQIIGYEYSKITDEGIKPRDRVYPTSALLLDRIRNFWDESWTQQINVPRPGNAKRSRPKSFVGPIASGNKVVASTKFRQQLVKRWPKLIGLEMEGEGVFAAAFDRPQIPATLVIRGICDMADERKSDDWQAYAAHAVAAFTISFLKSGPVEPLTKAQPEETPSPNVTTGRSDHVRNEVASLLVDIGKWAASELKERWVLVRQKEGEEEATELDLSRPREQVDRVSEALLQDVAAERGVAQVERVLILIERKRGLILEWKEMKLDNEEAFNRQELDRAAYRLKQQELDQKIAQAMTEIEADLYELGVQVQRTDSADS